MTPATDDDLRPGLPPPQIRLGTLLWLIGVCCAIFAVIALVGPYGAVLLVLFLLAVGAHVAGNAIGTRLRENGDHPLAAGKGWTLAKREPRRLTDDDFAPATRLGQRYSLGITIVVTTTVGVVVGGTFGGAFLALVNWEHARLVNIALGVIASGVLGGIGGFATSSFVHVLIGAQLQALRDAKRR